MRDRYEHAWGLPHLSSAARARVRSANTLMLNFLFLCERVHEGGGAYLLEHPEDRGCIPFASIWITQIWLQLAGRTGAKHRILDQ